MPSPAPCPTPAGCPTPQPCSEVFDAQCVVYTGADIECGNDTVVTSNTNVADSLKDIVDYLCAQLATPQCCPTFLADISYNVSDQSVSVSTTNGTGPYTYEWTLEDNYPSYTVSGSTTSSSLFLDRILERYCVYPVDSGGLGSKLYATLLKVKVTDSNGQVAIAYYNYKRAYVFIE